MSYSELLVKALTRHLMGLQAMINRWAYSPQPCYLNSASVIAVLRGLTFPGFHGKRGGTPKD